MICFVGGLYHSISHHEYRRIKCYLTAFTIFVVGHWLGYIYLLATDNSGYAISVGLIILAVGIALYTTFICYVAGYAEAIRRLGELHFPVD